MKYIKNAMWLWRAATPHGRFAYAVEELIAVPFRILALAMWVIFAIPFAAAFLGAGLLSHNDDLRRKVVMGARSWMTGDDNFSDKRFIGGSEGLAKYRRENP